MPEKKKSLDFSPEYGLVTSYEGFLNLQSALAGKSAETRRKYIDWIRLFYEQALNIRIDDYAPDATAIPIQPFVVGVTPALVEAWLGKYAAAGHSKSGLGQARAAIAFVARMLVLAKQAPTTLWHDLKLIRMPDHAATGAYGESAGRHGSRWLSPEEVRMLINSAKLHQNQNRARRDVALLWLMVTLGLRREEVAGVEWDNLNRRGGNWVLRVRGKRNKWRAVGVPPETIMILQPWAEAINAGTRQTLPPGLILRRVWRSGKIAEDGITGNAVWRIVTDAWTATGMPGELAPHDLRRTAAAIALEAGAKEQEIQQMLGHDSIETTYRYLAPLRENTATYRIAQMLSDDGGFFGS